MSVGGGLCASCEGVSVGGGGRDFCECAREEYGGLTLSLECSESSLKTSSVSGPTGQHR